MKRFTSFLAAAGCSAALALVASAQNSTTAAPPPPTSSSSEAGEIPDSSANDRVSTSAIHDRMSTASTRFKALDTDGDNRISRAEFTLAPNLNLQTGSGGADKAGQLDTGGRASERRTASATTDSSLEAGRSPRSYELFNQLDTDKDGFLSRAELAGGGETEGK